MLKLLWGSSTETWTVLAKCHMVAVFRQIPGKYEDVINVDDGETMEELPEHLVHEALEDRW